MKPRIHSIDLFRGFAILFMLAANAWPELYPFDETPILLRIVYSTAAPIFIFLSGVSIRIVQESGKTSGQVWKRSLQIIFLGVLIDTLVWQINPFATYDVLYLIGFSSIVVWYVGRISSNPLKWSIALLLFLSHLFFLSEYQFEMDDVPISQFPDAYSFPGTLKRLFLDGWFPIFPWLSVSLLGYLSFANRAFFETKKQTLFILGITCLLLFPFSFLLGTTPQAIRGGYVELFYPVKNWFYVHLAGVFSIIIWSYSLHIESFRWVRRIGSYSLSIYVFHTIYIHFLLPHFEQEASSFSWFILLALLASLLLCTFVLSYVLKKHAQSLKSGKLSWLGFVIGM
jgi:uncharacterized membrane protein YeiB